MKRGSALERGLAYAGIVLWVTWGLLALISPTDYIVVGISALAVIVGIREISRWRSGEKYSGTHRRTGQRVYPRWAWFAVGAIPVTFVMFIVEAAIGAGSKSHVGAWPIVDIIAWIAGGLAAEKLLTNGAARRESGSSGVGVPARPDR